MRPVLSLCSYRPDGSIVGMQPRADVPVPAALLRAAGVRATWEAAPEQLRAWVERSLGSPVESAESQVGGFSPGVAARLRCADGTRAFVKAVGVELNPRTPDLLRAEATVLDALPPSSLRPTLLGTYDDGDWVALLLEDIEGTLPVLPWHDGDLARVLAALDRNAAELTPSPWAAAPRVADELAKMFTGWAAITEAPPEDLDPWARRHLDRLVELERAALRSLDAGDTLCHVDARSDNILLAEDRVVLVDWNWAAVGPPWFDTVLLGFEVVSAGGDLDAMLAASPRTRSLDPAVPIAVLTAAAGMFQGMHRTAPPPGLPTIRAWQQAYATALTAWVRDRTGWR